MTTRVTLRRIALLLCIAIFPRTGAAAEPPKASPSGDSLGFDLFGELTPPKPQDGDPARRAGLERKVRVRRRMLTAHQAFGFVTLGLLAATLVLGQLNYQDKYGGGDFTNRYASAHLSLGVGSGLSFATTGLLAAFAPNPYPKPLRADAALAHKILMITATAAMVAQLVLGPITASRGGSLGQRDLAIGHLALGYTTFALMAAGTLTYVF